jgi:hypothetical protein
VAGVISTGDRAAIEASSVLTPRPSDVTLVRSVVDRYLGALNALDPNAARRAWPTVDVKALARAFDRLEKESLELDDCQIALGAGDAVASCRGRGTYVPKFGNKHVQSQARVWIFKLRRTVDNWQIVSMDAR